MTAGEEQKKGSLRASIHDGLCWSVMSGLGESYISAYAVFLKALPIQLGIIAALPALAAAMSQHFGVYVLEKYKTRVPLLKVIVAIHGALWVPIACLGLFLTPSPQTTNIYLILLLVYFSFGGAANPIWSSLMGDLVPASSRGQYFALRNRLVSAVTFVSLIVGGYILQIWENFGEEAIGFLFIFLLAGVFRLCCVHFIEKHYDPPFETSLDEPFSFTDFIKATPRSNFAKFALFQGSVNFGLQFAAPFFSLFMLRELHFTYLEFTLQISMIIMGQILTFSHWGKLSDRFGTKRILSICTIGVSFTTLVWPITSNFYILMLNHIIAGSLWAGFNLSIGNFLYDAVSPPKRARCAAYVGIVNGIASISGALLGGLMLSLDWLAKIDIIPHFNFMLVFILSGIFRGLSALYFLPKIKEVRDVENITTKDFIFRVLAVRPFSGISYGVITSKRLPHQK